jgi:uncharacterized protein
VNLVLDTNVFISGVFFTGPPFKILQAWRDRELELVVSPDILLEYQRVGEALAVKYSGVDITPMLQLVLRYGKLYETKPLPKPLCDDPTDDKFFECALASRCKLIVSGDKHLLRVSGYRNIQVLRPRAFVDEYL